LQTVFPHVSLFLENHVEGVLFQPHVAGGTCEVRVDAGEPAPDNSHFFVAVCANRPQIGNPTFVYVPRAANVLREREHHIAKLESELDTKDQWLAKAQEDLAEFDREHQKLLEMFRGLKDELEKSNQWAEQLNGELQERRARVTALQEELERDQESARKLAEGYAAKVGELEEDLRVKTKWAVDTEARVEQQTQALVRAVDQLHKTEKDLEERTAWAEELQEESRKWEEAAQRFQGQVVLFEASRWVKLGRRVGLGPKGAGE